MRSKDLYPANRPDLNMDPSVIQSTARPGRRSTSVFLWFIVLIIAILYAVSPLDFVPDVIPILGWVDDVVITLSAAIIALQKIIKR